MQAALTGGDSTIADCRNYAAHAPDDTQTAQHVAITERIATITENVSRDGLHDQCAATSPPTCYLPAMVNAVRSRPRIFAAASSASSSRSSGKARTLSEPR